MTQIYYYSKINKNRKIFLEIFEKINLTENFKKQLTIVFEKILLNILTKIKGFRKIWILRFLVKFSWFSLIVNIENFEKF